MRLQHQIEFQREVIGDLKKIADVGKHGTETFCCYEPDTGEPLTYGKFYDRYSRMLLILDELERKHGLA
jgi:hypothetical protein